MSTFILCSECFKDTGLKLDATVIGLDDETPCPNCGRSTGKKLDRDLVAALAYRFFVWGTLQRVEYGAAPIVQFNKRRASILRRGSRLTLHLIEEKIGVGFFYYGPRLWMVGENEPLKALQRRSTRQR
jgi:hypothetical protein